MWKRCGTIYFGRRELVVEIASNDGYLLQYFQVKGIPVLGLEPARNVAKVAQEKGIPTLTNFLAPGLPWSLAPADDRRILLSRTMFWRMFPDLNDFVRGLKLLLKSGGTITIEVPHLLRLMEGCQFDTIYHEHFSYFSLLTLDEVSESLGLLFSMSISLRLTGFAAPVHLPRECGRAGHAERATCRDATPRMRGRHGPFGNVS